jgi:hypothetical protein
MPSKDQILRMLSERIDILLAIVAICLITFILVGRPLASEGTILFGDFVPTLELSQYLRNSCSLWSIRNSFNYLGYQRLPYLSIFCLPFYALNAPAEAFFKFMILSIFVISGVSMYIAARYFIGGYRADRKTVFLCSLIASLLYAFNPWVMDRVYHTYLLVTYSLIPLIFLISAKIFTENQVDLRLVLTLTLLCSLGSTSPHSVFFIFLLITSLYVYFLLLDRKKYVSKTKNFALVMILYVLVNAFWILPLSHYSYLSSSLYPDYVLNVDTVRLLSRNSGITNVFRLVAYWWPKVSYSFDTYPLNAFWVFASFAIPTLSFLALVFHRKNRFVTYLSVLGVFLIFLAMGTNSPLANFYEWLCFGSPMGWLFRDPNKWMLLLPLVFSVLLAFTCLGFINLLKRIKNVTLKNATTLGFISLVLVLVFAYVTPSATNYFNGPFKPVVIPPEIYEVNSWLANDSGSFQVLWLPSYAEHGSTWVYGGLSGAFELDSSAKSTFDVGDKHARSYLNYFEKALLENKTNWSADYLNPLNVRYIIFHNDSIYEEYASRLFRSLQNQRDLELVKHNGIVYVFENKGWSSKPFQSFSKTAVITGGFDRFVSLCALKTLNLSKFCIVFADQDIPVDNSLNADLFVLSGDALNDALPFFLNECLVIPPYDSTTRYEPDQVWSRASLSDLSGGPFHPYVESFGVDCWDFDYDKGVVVTSASASKLSISFSWSLEDGPSLFLRVFENEAGGNLSLYLDNSLCEVINTRSELDRFVWKAVNATNVTRGNHVLTMENVEGLNAVNLIAMMPEDKASNISHLFEEKLRNKDVLYALEGESDMLLENASLITDYGGKASNGIVARLSASSSASRSMQLTSGNYTFFVEGRGRIAVTVDGSYYTCEANMQEFGWTSLDPLYLAAGTHELKVSAPSENGYAELDVLWLLETENPEHWNKSGLDTASNRILSVKQIDSTKFVVELLPGEPFMLCSSQAYNPTWAASLDRQSLKSRRVFGIVNGFWVSMSEKCTVVVELQPQQSFHVGVAVSLSTLLACGLYVTCRFCSKKLDKRQTAAATHQPKVT